MKTLLLVIAMQAAAPHECKSTEVTVFNESATITSSRSLHGENGNLTLFTATFDSPVAQGIVKLGTQPDDAGNCDVIWDFDRYKDGVPMEAITVKSAGFYDGVNLVSEAPAIGATLFAATFTGGQ
jgi:hypothetical protein